MPSPFPGMDPYLEKEGLWPAFHHQMITCLYQTLLPGLVDRYRARVGQRHYITEQALFTSVIRENHDEEFIEIRLRGENRLLTLIEIIGPDNKGTPEGREAFLTKRRESKTPGANLVDIDLVLQGQPVVDLPLEATKDWDYTITVTRSTQPERPEIHTAALQRRLPRFRLPLARDDRDNLVDLNTVIARCYEQGGFAAKIDYTHDPPGMLTPENRQWVDDLLKQQKLR